MKIDYRKSREQALLAVKDLIIDRLSLDMTGREIDDDAALFGAGLGLDSIDALDLVIGIEERFNLTIGEDDLHVFRSVNSLVDYVLSRLDESQSPASVDLLGKVEFKQDPEVLSAYERLREEHIAFLAEEYVYEIGEDDESVKALNNIVSTDIALMEPNKISITAIFSASGGVEALAQLYMFEDLYWLVSETDISGSFSFVENASLNFKNISKEYSSLVLEGPYAWRVIRDLVGFEVLGLSYSRFMETVVGSLPVIIGRVSSAGEYGYRLSVESERLEELIEVLKGLETDSPINIISKHVASKVFDIASCEMRSPRMGITINSGDGPIANELRWIVGFRKEAFIGKDSIQAALDTCSTLVVAFATNRAPDELERMVGSEVIAEGKAVGVVKHACYSSTLQLFLGFAEMSLEWGYAGLSGLVLGQEEGGEVITLSSPAFLPLSSKVQMS